MNLLNHEVHERLSRPVAFHSSMEQSSKVQECSSSQGIIDMVDLSIICHLGKQPITPDTPCGKAMDEDDEDYTMLRAEMAHSQRLAEKTHITDWDNIVRLSVSILSAKSKDLQMASYLSYALFEKHGYSGLEAALTLYHDLLEEYWHDLFPQKLRGRIAAMTWIAEKLDRAVMRRHPDTAEVDTVRRCQ